VAWKTPGTGKKKDRKCSKNGIENELKFQEITPK
jgi:hypothetical protein